MLPAMRSLVISLFSRDLLVNQLRYLQCLNLVNNYLHEYIQYLHSIWFLDGRTSILVIAMSNFKKLMVALIVHGFKIFI